MKTENKINFEATKEYVLNFARENNACDVELNKVLKAENFEDLIKVVNGNIDWVSNKKLFNQLNIVNYFPLDLIKAYELNMGVDNLGFKNSGNWNSGNRNSGYSNSGNWNSGNWNSGNWNSGNSNSGDSNSGNWNSGYRNSGNWNSGNRNSGNWNSGNWNSGDSNSGYRNSGNWNSGNWNSGDSNSGYRNSGVFCTDSNPKVWIFDQPTNMTVKEWEQSDVRKLMTNIDLTIFIQSDIMSEQEKQEYPNHETTGGYLKTITIKEAWANFWGNLSENHRQLFLDLPNFDADKFEEITGIKTKIR